MSDISTVIDELETIGIGEQSPQSTVDDGRRTHVDYGGDDDITERLCELSNALSEAAFKAKELARIVNENKKRDQNA